MTLLPLYRVLIHTGPDRNSLNLDGEHFSLGFRQRAETELGSERRQKESLHGGETGNINGAVHASGCSGAVSGQLPAITAGCEAPACSSGSDPLTHSVEHGAHRAST